MFTRLKFLFVGVVCPAARPLVTLLCTLCLAACIVVPCAAQQITGEVNGVVKDSLGAVIVGANVYVTNTETNELDRTLKTNQQGRYEASLLKIGTYSVKVEAPGFVTAELVGITVNVNDALMENVTLQVGTSETVVVTVDEGTKPNLENNENSTLIGSKEITELALNTRNFEEMALLQPGVSYGGSGEQNSGQVDPTGNRNSAGLSINGLQQSQTSYLLDGVDILSHTSSTQVVIFPSIESIRQIQTIRNNYGAQYGGGGSAEITTVTKSGGSNFHGDAYYFFRHQALEATPIFDVISGLPKPTDRYNDYGYTIGGPLFIPHLYPRSKSKTFFFFSQEFKRLGQGIEQTSDFIPFLPETYGYFNSPVCVSSPAGAGTACTRAPLVTNSPFAGFNYHICVTTTKPLPTGVTLPGCSSTDPIANVTGEQIDDDVIRPSILSTSFGVVPGNPNFQTYSQTSTTNETQELGRLDQQFSTRLNGFLRIVDDQITQHIPNGIYGGSTFPGVAKSTVMTYGRNYLAHLTWLASANTVLEFGGSYLPYQTKATPTGFAVAANSPDVQIALPFPNTTGRIPNITLVGVTLGSVGNLLDHSATYQAFENTTLALGPHTFVFGVNYEFLTDHGNNGTLNAGNLTFSGANNVATAAATGCTPVPAGGQPVLVPGACTVDPYSQTFAYLLLGRASNFSQASVDPVSDPRAALYEAFFVDNWRANARLTLNAGVRYSIYQAPWEATTSSAFPNGKLGGFQPEGFNPATAPQINCTASTCNIPTASGGSNSLDGIVGGGGSTSPYGRAISRTPLLNFAPRVGFALNVYGDGKTSLRGGFGIFYEQQPLSTFQNDIAGNPAYVQNLTYGAPADISNPGALAPNTRAIANIAGVNRNWVQPYVEGWNLGIQQQLTKADLLEINYVGNNTIHLQGTEDLNSAVPGRYLQTGATGSCAVVATGGTSTVQTGVAYNGTGVCYPQAAEEILIDKIRPYQGWGEVSYVTTRYFSDYNGLEATLIHHQNRALLFALNYTWSKAMTNNQGPPPTIIAPQYTPLNRNDVNLEWGPAALDRRNIFISNFVFTAPNNTGLHGIKGAALNGWVLSAIIGFSSGLHQTAYEIAYDPAGTGDSGNIGGTATLQRPDLSADPNYHSTPRTQTNWFRHDQQTYNYSPTPTATWTQQPPGGRFGNEKVGAILGPGYQTENVSLFKNFELPENMRFQLRCEAFNLFNHVSWQSIGLQPGAAAFGTVTAAYPMRKLQLGVKLLF